MNKDINQAIEHLYRQRTRRRFVRFSLLTILAVVILSWMSGEFFSADLFAERRLHNLQRFLGDLIPYPLQGREYDGSIASDWFTTILSDRGWEALNITLAISVLAIVLAAAGSLVLTLPAARNIATAEPFLPEPGKHSAINHWFWGGVVALTRLLLIFLRAIPEYIWAFLLLSIFGLSPWPLVLALALHNLGIISKLTAEIVENLPSSALSTLRGLGASRLQIAGSAIVPMAMPRFLMFFFYRWETCVREATVLGMLGIVSLGFWIQDARARNHYDEMFLFILLGAVLILAGDLVSALARKFVRNSR